MSNFEIETPLRNHLEDPADPERIRKVRARLRKNLRVKSQKKLYLAIAAAFSLIVLFQIGLVLHLREPEQGPLRLEGGRALNTLEVGPQSPRGEHFQLSDGSTLILAPGARIRLIENTSRLVVFSMERGGITFDVQPDRDRHFRVRARDVEVDVIGTRFHVELETEDIEVRVDRGLVRVSGQIVRGGFELLSSGQAMTFAPEPPEKQPLDPTDESPQSAQNAEPPELSESEGTEERPEVSRRVEPRWRSLARSKNYRQAFSELGRSGIAREASRTKAAEDLFALADVARFSGHPREAVMPLEQIISNFGGSSHAAMASFTLGRIYLESFGEPRRAERYFSQCLRMPAPSTLSEAALARIVEAKFRAGDRNGARQAAQRYIQQYPRGRFLRQVERWSETNE